MSIFMPRCLALAFVLAIGVTACGEDPVQPIPIEGNWGTVGLVVIIEPVRGSVEKDCAHGTIDEPVVLNRYGRFDVSGTYQRDCGGPCSPQLPPVHPARFEGTIEGDTMTITITLTDTGQVMGPYTVVRDAPGVLHKCV